MEAGRAYCGQCQSWVKAERKSTNHLLHLIMSLITFGFWIIIWLLVAVDNNRAWTCAQCGSGTFNRPPKPKPKLRREIAAEVMKTIVKPKPTVTEKPTSGQPMARGEGRGV